MSQKLRSISASDLSNCYLIDFQLIDAIMTMILICCDSGNSGRKSCESPSPTKPEVKSKWLVFGFGNTNIFLSIAETPPIKAPVGLARGPDLKNVKSKIGSLENVKHRPSNAHHSLQILAIFDRTRIWVEELQPIDHNYVLFDRFFRMFYMCTNIALHFLVSLPIVQ